MPWLWDSLVSVCSWPKVMQHSHPESHQCAEAYFMANWGIVTSSPRPHPPYSHSVLPTFHALIECILSLNTATASLLIPPSSFGTSFTYSSSSCLSLIVKICHLCTIYVHFLDNLQYKSGLKIKFLP